MKTQASDSRDRDLLIALFADDAASLEAWRRWYARTDIDTLTPSEFRLQAMLWRRLEANGVMHPWIPRLRGTYRYTWTHNQVSLRDLHRVTAQFTGAGVRAVATSGVPVVHLLYDDPAATLVDSVELLIAPSELKLAHKVMCELGWHAVTSMPPVELQSVLGPMVYARSGHRNVVLHTHVAKAPVTAASNSAVMARARSHPGPSSVPVIDEADLLVLECVHRAAEAPNDLLRWAPAAIALLTRLRSEGRVNEVWNSADALGVAGRLGARLRQLQELVGDVLAVVRVRKPESASDHPLVWCSLDEPQQGSNVLQSAQRNYARYRAWLESNETRASFVSLLKFVSSLYSHEWQVPYWKLPISGTRRLAEKARERLAA